jgi:hypothetical protein
MASSWSALKVELLETGANAGSWGTLTNANLGDAVLGEAITGSATVDFSSDADVTITLTDAATTQAARNLRLNITESSSGIGSVRNLILGSGCQIEKFYLINNTGTGAKTVKNTSGTGISVPAGKATLVYNNGTNVVDAASYFTSLTLGSALPITSGGTGTTSTTFTNLTTNVTGLLPIANGGTATATPALVQGTGVTITGTWPNQTINATGTGGTVTSVGGTGTVNGISLSGSVTTSGSLTLGGTLSGVSLTSQVSGTLPVANGGTNLTSFTSGGVVYASSSSALATGSVLSFDGTSLGIGTSSPSAKLEVSNAFGASTFGESARLTNTSIDSGTKITFYGKQGSDASAKLSGAIGFNQTNNNDSNGKPAFIIETGNNGSISERARIDSIGYLSGVWADKVSALGNSGTSTTITCTAGNVFTATLTGNCTFTLAAPSSTTANTATSFTLILTNDATAGRSVAWAGGTFNFPGGAAALTRTTTAGATDIWFFFSPNGGTTWYGSIPMANLTT